MPLLISVWLFSTVYQGKKEVKSQCFTYMFEKVDQDYNIEDIQEKNKRTMKKKTFPCPLSFISMRDRQWIFGSFYCRLNSFTSCFTVSFLNERWKKETNLISKDWQSSIIFCQVSISVFTLLAMTLERHKAIMTPLAPRKSHKTLWVKNASTSELLSQSIIDMDNSKLVRLIKIVNYHSFVVCIF